MKIMFRVFLALSLLLPIFANSAASPRIDFNEYKNRLGELAVECAPLGRQAFTGFCLTQKYDNQTNTSIAVALQLIGYEDFSDKCDHTDFSSRKDLLTQAMHIEDTKQFYEEMKSQKAAIKNYSDYFNVCKAREENDLSISNKLKWFEYMIDKSNNYIKDKDSGLYLYKKPQPQ